MLCNPFIRMAVLSCIALSAACAGDTPQGDVSGNTEINLMISDPATAPEEILLLIDFVSYRITCPDSGLSPYDDSIDLAGNFEVDVNANPPVWELVTNLPLADPNDPFSYCTISLWVFFDGKIQCSGTETISVIDDGDPLTTNKVNVVLECSLSVSGPHADVGIEGTYEFIHGNYCPKLVWLGADPSATSNEPFSFDIDTSSFDWDSTCGLNCDPQTCDFTQNPPVCTAAQDPGFTTTLFAPAGHGTFVTATATGVTATATGTPLPDGAGTPVELQATFECDPLFPGPTEICAFAYDGDDECTQFRCTTVDCPDLCAGVDCEDVDEDDNPIECTRDRCDPLDGSCSNDPAPLGIACQSCSGTCDGNGACNGPAWTAANEFTGTFTIMGTQQSYSATLVNPYSGATVPVSGTFRVNNTSYKGLGANDTLEGITGGGNPSEVLLIQDPVGTQTFCGVETLRSRTGFDVMVAADGYIILDDMVIEGGLDGDLLWANAGDDTVLGDMGNDIIDGGYGDDNIDGGLGDDTITLWPGSGFDSISGGMGIDTVEIDAEQNQIRIKPAANPDEFYIFYLKETTPMAWITGVELLVLNDALIDLATCTGGIDDVCNLCGNDDLNGGERCDDGNNVDGDGCAADCTAGY